MSSRTAKWGGGALAAAALIGLCVYFALVGLDEADKLASVLSAFLGLLGLALALYGTFADAGPSAPATSSRSPLQPRLGQSASSRRSRHGGTFNTISGGTFQGPVFQGQTFGTINLASPQSGLAPDGPRTWRLPID